MKLLTAAILFLYFATATPAAAQGFNVDLNNLPKPLTDLFNTFNRIKIEIPNTTFAPKRIFNDITNNSSGALDYLNKLWMNINNWFRGILGVSLGEIVRVLGNFAIWLLELVVKLLKSILSGIGE